ncbi:hypothetical protein PG985_000143 [Apiospora marii]|uniref:uncharacterized protein n=1 Tax=Apiospora marii TaxID=335849 RepID=UPI003130D27E
MLSFHHHVGNEAGSNIWTRAFVRHTTIDHLNGSQRRDRITTTPSRKCGPQIDFIWLQSVVANIGQVVNTSEDFTSIRFPWARHRPRLHAREWRRGPGRKKSWNACPVQKRPTRRQSLRNTDRTSPPRARLDPYPNLAAQSAHRATKKQYSDDGPEHPNKRIRTTSRKGGKANDHVLDVVQDDLFHPRPDRWRVRQSVLRRQKIPQPAPQHASLPDSVQISISEHPVALDLKIERRGGLADECCSAFQNNPCLRGDITGNVARPSWADVARLPNTNYKTGKATRRSVPQASSRIKHNAKARGIPGLRIPDFRDYQSFADYIKDQGKAFFQKCAKLRHMAMGSAAATEKDYQKLIKVVRKHKTQLFPLFAAWDICEARIPDQFLARTAKPGLCSLHFCLASSCSTVLWTDGQDGHMHFSFSGDTVVGVEGDERFQTSLGEYLVLDPRRLLQDCQTV